MPPFGHPSHRASPMSDKVRFLMSFRARLILLDNWAAKRADAEIDRQSKQVTAAVNDLIGDFYQAVNLAQQNLDKEEYLYQTIKPGQMPPAVEHIMVADSEGKVKDSTLREKINDYIPVPNEAVAQE